MERTEASTDSLLAMIESICPEAIVRRIDQDHNELSVTALLKIKDPKVINKFSQDFQEKFSNGRFSLIDDSSMPNE